MFMLRNHAGAFVLATAVFVSPSVMNQASAATAADLHKVSRHALEMLYKTEPVSRTLSSTTRALLEFPNIIKTVMVFVGSYGEGELTEDSKVAAHYSSVIGSRGQQAGVMSYGYAVFLMTDKVIEHVKDSKDREITAGPTVVAIRSIVAGGGSGGDNSPTATQIGEVTASC
jgi:lipid-binding SYLF domain-containing protein